MAIRYLVETLVEVVHRNVPFEEQILWLLPILLVAGAALGGEQLRKHVREKRAWVAGGTIAWYAVWISARYAAGAAGVSPLLWLSRAFLGGLSSMGNVMFSIPVFLLGLVLFVVRKQLPDLVQRLTDHLQTLEVGGVKLSLGEAEPPTASLAAGWWSDVFADAVPLRDVPAGEGAMQEMPATDIPEYHACRKAARRMLNDLTDANQTIYGPRINALEKRWHGEYREHTQMTVDLIWRAIRLKRLTKVEDKFLATCLTCRHIQLYLNGEKGHAEQFLRCLRVVSPEHALGTLRHAVGYWFLFVLCQRRHLGLAERLLRDPLFCRDDMNSTRTAYTAYLAFAQGRYDQAFAHAAGGVTGEEPPEAQLVRAYIAARVCQRQGQALQALHHAEQAMAIRLKRPYAVSQYIHQMAMRTYAWASIQLKLHDRLVSLTARTEEALRDPYVLNLMAVYLVDIGRRAEAVVHLNQALTVIGADQELEKTIRANLDVLKVKEPRDR